MTDDRAEQAFRTALATRAESFAPGLLDVPAARRRLRWPALVAAAAAAILVAGFVAVVAGHRHEAAPAGDLPQGWRWESFHDVTVGVPDTWGYAPTPGGDWCAAPPSRQRSGHGLPRDGYVDLDVLGGGELGILCAGQRPDSLTELHLSFVSAADEDALPLAPGWSSYQRIVGGTTVYVVADAPHRALAHRILATAHVVRRDPYGCATRSPIESPKLQRPSPAWDVATVTHVDSIAVCQYGLSGQPSSDLHASRLLTGAAAQAELAALQAAPIGSGPNRVRNCGDTSSWDPYENALVLRLTADGATHEMYVHSEDCHDNGIDDGTHVRQLTIASCSPLYAGRVIQLQGIRSAFDRCQPRRAT